MVEFVNAVELDFQEGDSPKTWPHTVPDEPNRVLYVVIAHRGNNSLDGITYAGISMTQVVNASGGGGAAASRVRVFELLDPPVGTADVVAQVGDRPGAASVLYKNVAQTDHRGPIAVNDVNSDRTTMSVDVNSDGYDKVLSFSSIFHEDDSDKDNVSVGSGETLRAISVSSDTTGVRGIAVHATKPPDGSSTTMEVSWTDPARSTMTGFGLVSTVEEPDIETGTVSENQQITSAFSARLISRATVPETVSNLDSFVGTRQSSSNVSEVLDYQDHVSGVGRLVGPVSEQMSYHDLLLAESVNIPGNLRTTNITATSARAEWDAPG